MAITGDVLTSLMIDVGARTLPVSWDSRLCLRPP
jgi:hypothetical protein